MDQEVHEDPGSSPAKKKRGLQERDYRALRFESIGLGRYSGKWWERATYVAEKVKAMRADGHMQEADLLASAMDVSMRAAYEIARLPEEAFLLLCEMVEKNEAPNLVIARRAIQKAAREGHIPGIEAPDPVALSRSKNGMYRITSQRNHSSILVSAQDLIELQAVIQYIMPELEAKSEDPGSS